MKYYASVESDVKASNELGRENHPAILIHAASSSYIIKIYGLDRGMRKKMKKRINIRLAIMSILIVLAPAVIAGRNALFQNEARPGEDALVLKARAFVEAMSREDFPAAVKDFDETMLKLSGPEKLAPFWKALLGQVGTFKGQADVRNERQDPYDVVFVSCEFEKVRLTARLVFDKTGKVAGFGFIPYYPPAKYEPPAYADPGLFEKTSVTIGSGQWQLPGTLTVPKGAGRFPALVLVHGSGPNDRDESLGPNKPFKDLAGGLASRGIVVVRYKVYGQKIVSDRALEATLTVKEETIDDALEAVKVLRRNPRVDPMHIFTRGHSLGGMLMPRIALAGEKSSLTGFIIAAGLTRPLEDTILQQMKYIFSLGGPLSEESKKQLQNYQVQVDKVKALKDSDAGAGEKLFNARPRYWLDLRGYYPPAVAEKVKQPMLILQGGRDYQVTTQDFDNWKKALGGRPDVSFKLYPKLNHLFFEGQSPITPNEYQYVHGSLADYVIKDIADWIGQVSAAHR